MAVVGPLLERFTYDHTTHLRGVEAARAGRKVAVEPRRLYAFDRRGRLLVPSGYADALYRGLRAAGHAVDYRDYTGDGGRPAALTPGWELLGRHCTFREKQEDVVRRMTPGRSSTPGGHRPAPAGHRQELPTSPPTRCSTRTPGSPSPCPTSTISARRPAT